MAVLRTLIGETLRTIRLHQDRTLREVSSAARVSLGYLSEVERGEKEASSELLASICRALGVRLSDVLRDVSESLSAFEPEPQPVEALVAVGGRRAPVGPVADTDLDSGTASPAADEAPVAATLRLASARPTRAGHDVVAAA